MNPDPDKSSEGSGAGEFPFETEIDERLRAVKSPAERQSLAGVLRNIAGLPLEHTRAALETSALIAAVSLRASIEFLRAAPAVAHTLEPAELRAWGELGRRLTMIDVETGVSFFIAGLGDFAQVPSQVRPFVFQVCARQMILSATTAAETFRHAPSLAAAVGDADLLRSIYEIAGSISRRSAKHSAEFLQATPHVVASLKTDPSLIGEAIDLVKAFSDHAGGIAADAWAALPPAFDRLPPAASLRLLNRAATFLDRGGAVAFHYLNAGGDLLRALPDCFESWTELLWTIAPHGNAALVAFIRASPRFFQNMALTRNQLGATALAQRVIELTREVARSDAEAALACLRSSAKALHTVSIEQFESWARAGLIAGDARARRSYYSLETRSSNEALRAGDGGVSLESVQALLRLYVEALTGQAVEIAALAAVPLETRIADGRTIHLPSVVSEFSDDELDFRLYKVLAAHAAGQIEFGTYERDTDDLRAAFAALADLYDWSKQNERDSFAIDSAQLADLSAPPAVAGAPAMIDYRQLINLFPIPALARRIFGTVENGRIDRQL